MTAIVLAASLAGCASTSDRPPQRWVEQGPPVSCINTFNIRNIEVVDSRTINFVVSSRQMFRNDLPMACPGLTFNRAVRHNSRSSQLCSANSITVSQPGNARGQTCNLGRFQPLARVDATPAP